MSKFYGIDVDNCKIVEHDYSVDIYFDLSMTDNDMYDQAETDEEIEKITVKGTVMAAIVFHDEDRSVGEYGNYWYCSGSDGIDGFAKEFERVLGKPMPKELAEKLKKWLVGSGDSIDHIMQTDRIDNIYGDRRLHPLAAVNKFVNFMKGYYFDIEI